MTDGRMVAWIRKHYVGLNVATAVLWSGYAVTQVIPLVNGDSGPNGGHVFRLVLGLLVAALTGASAVLFAINKRKKPQPGPSGPGDR